MGQLKVPEQPKVQTIAYSNLLGVDYQSDQTEISRRHSPDMVNMISDLGGNPVKRYGYRNIGGTRNYDLIVEVGGVTYGITIGHTTDVYELTFNDDGTITSTRKLYTTIFDAYSGDDPDASTALGRIYLFGDDVWASFDPTSTQSGQDIAGMIRVGTRYMYWIRAVGERIHLGASLPEDESIIPTVYTMFKPNGSEMVSLPAGTDITGATQGVNLLTPYRRIEYCVQTDTAAENVFYLPSNQVAGADAKIEILDKDTLEWVVATDAVITTASSVYPPEVKPVGYALNPSDTTQHFPWRVVVRFSFPNYPPYISVTSSGDTHLEFRNSDGTASGVRVPAGIPNVRITYAPFDMTVVGTDSGHNVIKGIYSELREKLLKSKVRTFYDGRLWVAVDNRIYYSRVNEPFNIDDDYYIEIDSPVKSLVQASGGLAIVGEGSHPIYIANGSFNEEYNAPIYSVKASNADVTPIATGNQLIFNDEPIVFTKDGIYGLQSNYYSDKYSIMRSGKINRRLCAEPEYDNAVAVVYKNYLWVAVGTHMYILDGRHKDSSRNGDNSYECYYFEGMPEIKRMWVASNKMLFADDTATYTWNDDLEEKMQYRDLPEWDNDEEKWVNGKPVKARWTSLLDGDNAPHYYKTLQKKGTMVTVSPPMQTSCQITLVRDAHDKIYVGRFNGATFSLTDAVLDAFTKKKVKKYKRLQFVVENNEAEPFGIISIVKSYILNNYAKR